MSRLPWLKVRKKTSPELPLEPPIWFGNRSNGEYFRPATALDRKIRKLILETADANARRLGMDRRDFLASSMGMATSLWAINFATGCSSDGATSGDAADSGVDQKKPPKPEAKFCVPPEALLDDKAACRALGGDDFIFDIQTHWFDKNDVSKFPEMMQAFGYLINSATENRYINQMFLNSDTTMAALTAWPGVACTRTRKSHCGLPLTNQHIVESRARINELAGKTQRVVNHIQLLLQEPNPISYNIPVMDKGCEDGAFAWKMYPGAFVGFPLDGPDAAKIIEHGIKLGVPLFCIHKGLPIGTFFKVDGNHPRDIGVIAKRYPEASFIIYHSSICAGFESCSLAPPEGPYDPKEKNPTGVNALIRSLEDNGIGPNENVYGEVGSALNEVMDNPTTAAHFFGKLMKYVGTDNVCWGTDCVIYGSPQPLIQRFRALEIPESMQEQYGYPPLGKKTAEGRRNQAKIFGLNAARVYKVDPEKKRCEVDASELSLMKRFLDNELGPNRWMFEEPGGPRTWDEFVAHSKTCIELGVPG